MNRFRRQFELKFTLVMVVDVNQPRIKTIRSFYVTNNRLNVEEWRDVFGNVTVLGCSNRGNRSDSFLINIGILLKNLFTTCFVGDFRTKNAEIDVFRYAIQKRLYNYLFRALLTVGIFLNERTITHARFVPTIPNSWDLIEQYARRVHCARF